MDDTTLYNLMKDMEDFESFPIPQSWFQKFNIPPRNPVSVREYLESNYAEMRKNERKTLPPLIINEPQQNGKLYAFVPEEEVKVDVVSRPFVLKEGECFPVVLPSLRDETAYLRVPTPQMDSVCECLPESVADSRSLRVEETRPL